MNKELILEWHHLLKFSLNDEQLKKRCSSLEEIIKSNEKDFWIDIVRVALELNVEGKNITAFVNAFQSKDESFPRLKIEKVIKGMAIIALIVKIHLGIEELSGINTISIDNDEELEEEESEESVDTETNENNESHLKIANLISSGILNATFLKQIKFDSKVPLLQSARDFLVKYSLKQRIINLEDYQDEISNIEEYSKGDNSELNNDELLSMLKATNALLRINSAQREEINILWWIFGAYSQIADDYFENIPQNVMSIIAARELYNLSQYSSEIPSSFHLLRKVIMMSKSDGLKTFTIKECIESLNASLKNSVIGVYTKHINELTPCLNALKQSQEKDGFVNLRLNIDESVDLIILSNQFYKELNFLLEYFSVNK